MWGFSVSSVCAAVSLAVRGTSLPWNTTADSQAPGRKVFLNFPSFHARPPFVGSALDLYSGPGYCSCATAAAALALAATARPHPQGQHPRRGLGEFACRCNMCDVFESRRSWSQLTKLERWLWGSAIQRASFIGARQRETMTLKRRPNGDTTFS